jgi:putative membrane protein
MHNWDDMHSWGWAGMAGGLIFWAVVIALVAWFVSTHRSGSSSRESASELLDRRLASGEIDLDEYNRRRAAMQRHDGP